MDYANFDELVGELFLVYRQNPPSKTQCDAIFERVRHIPEQAMREIVKNIEDTCDAIPRNLPKAIKQGWSQWLSSHPDRISHESYECSACGGDGHLFAKKDGYSYAFRCGHCKNWCGKSGDSVPMATVNQVMDAGFYFDSPKPVTKSKISKFIKKDKLEAIVKRLGGTLEPEPGYVEHDDHGNVYPMRKGA